MPQPIHELLVFRKIGMTGHVKHGMGRLVRPYLLAIRAFTGTYNMNLILIWKPHSNTILAVSPL